MSIADEIQKLQALQQSGVLSDVEFEQAKTRLLNSQTTAPSVNTGMDFIHKMGRSRINAMLGGVCMGIAKQTATPVWIWRLLFIATFIFSWGGTGIVYLLLWWLMPYND